MIKQVVQYEGKFTVRAQKMKFSIVDFFGKCDRIRASCVFGHIFYIFFNFVFCTVDDKVK